MLNSLSFRATFFRVAIFSFWISKTMFNFDTLLSAFLINETLLNALVKSRNRNIPKLVLFLSTEFIIDSIQLMAGVTVDLLAKTRGFTI